jgi:hypothetical protein
MGFLDMVVGSAAAALVLLGATEARAEDGAPSDLRRDSPADGIDTPSVLGSTAVLAQSTGGVDVVATVRQRALSSVVGSELDARASLARREGALSLVADGMLRRAIGTRDDVDAQASVTALVTLSRTVRVGAEGRARGEVVDGIVAADDTGRPVEVLAAAVASVTTGATTLGALAGFCWPRGPTPPGPALLGGASFAF